MLAIPQNETFRNIKWCSIEMYYKSCKEYSPQEFHLNYQSVLLHCTVRAAKNILPKNFI